MTSSDIGIILSYFIADLDLFKVCNAIKHEFLFGVERIIYFYIKICIIFILIVNRIRKTVKYKLILYLSVLCGRNVE